MPHEGAGRAQEPLSHPASPALRSRSAGGLPRPPPRPQDRTHSPGAPGPRHLASLLSVGRDPPRAGDLGDARGRPGPRPAHEVEEDLGLINLVNFGGGTYALTAEATDEGVEVVREVMADAFSKPARLSPAMAKALLLALDLVGDTFAVEGLESLASVRDKVSETHRRRPGRPPTVIVDDLMPPDPLDSRGPQPRHPRPHSGRDQVLHRFAPGAERAAGRALPALSLPRRLVSGGVLPQGRSHRGRSSSSVSARRVHHGRILHTSPRGRPGAGAAPVSVPPRDEAAWATVVFHPRWRTYLEERGTKYRLRADGQVEAQVPYLDELWIAQEVVRYLGDAVLEHPVSAREKSQRHSRRLWPPPMARTGYRTRRPPGVTLEVSLYRCFANMLAFFLGLYLVDTLLAPYFCSASLDGHRAGRPAGAAITAPTGRSGLQDQPRHGPSGSSA